jgi:uncharacterized lipoprotein
MKKILILMSVMMLLTSCNSVKPANQFDDSVYLTAESIPPLDLPPELEKKTYIDPFYPAPPGEYPEEGSESKNLLPPEMGKLIADEDAEEIEEIHKELE